jgi:hypothetical protein
LNINQTKQNYNEKLFCIFYERRFETDGSGFEEMKGVGGVKVICDQKSFIKLEKPFLAHSHPNDFLFPLQSGKMSFHEFSLLSTFFQAFFQKFIIPRH